MTAYGDRDGTTRHRMQRTQHDANLPHIDPARQFGMRRVKDTGKRTACVLL
jgi:hypothetical protein